MIVTDASVLAPALAADGDEGETARGRLRGESLAAPELVLLEVASAIRGHVRAGLIDERRARLAFGDLAAVPVQLTSSRPLLRRCWQLRDDLSAYDAAYVALAELMGATLVTADAAQAKAPGIRCEIELLR